MAEGIRTRLSSGSDFHLKRPTVSPEAYDAYLRGRYLLHLRSPEALIEAARQIEIATHLDPDAALAYSGLAEAYSLLPADLYGVKPPLETIPLARGALLKALALDPDSAEVHALLGMISFSYDWDWEMARREFLRALNLDSNYPEAHHWYGLFLTSQGDLDRGLEQVRESYRLSPRSPLMATGPAFCHYYRREFEQAARFAREALTMDPSFRPAHVCLILIQLATGRQDWDSDQLRRSLTLVVQSEELADGLRVALADDLTTLGATLQDLRGTLSPDALAVMASALGAESEALQWLEIAYQQRSDAVVFLGVEPLFDRIRDRPGFREVMRKVGLPEGSFRK